MDVLSCAKLVMLTLVAAIALQHLPLRWNHLKGTLRSLKKVPAVVEKSACYLTCYKNCIGNSEIETFASRCNHGCVMSRCFDPRPDAKIAKGCVNSCSESCKKS
ncbi:hypothetical protein ACJRO7_031036 [Eucalyptus globulus]|uniref:Thionin-like protein n=1 Tax=Eucalyptus globulus TaxID=34317 RepID=A0ABD3JJQ0_EUCGL